MIGALGRGKFRCGLLWDALSHLVLESFRDVYGYEAEAQRRGLGPEARMRFHQAHSQPVMDALYAWFEA